MGLRFGLLGTGYWAAETQGAALDAHPGAELAGVWGRDPAKAAALAERYGTRAYDDAEALIADVDAVAVALPPHIQGDLALRAAKAGRHLLLDKPVALSPRVADSIAAECAERGLASMVFFTNRFSDSVDGFVREAVKSGGWDGARVTMFASIFQPDNPFGASPWRREKGGLWDIGPHALSVVLPVLGPVEEVTAVVGPRETAHVLTRHRGGPVGSFALTLDAAMDAQTFEVALHGEHGWVTAPGGDRSAVTAFGNAVDRLLAQVEGTVGDPCDVAFGRDVVRILAAAEESARTGRTVRLP